VYLPRAKTWVREADGHVVGFISLLGNEVGAIFVDPEFHRSGIGRALMDRARALRGELEVEVFERNLPGRVFYAKLGFELIHQEVHDQTGFEVRRLRLAADNPMKSIGLRRPPIRASAPHPVASSFSHPSIAYAGRQIVVLPSTSRELTQP
jgi:putative acetyltransferase